MAGPAHVTLARLCELVYQDPARWRERRLIAPFTAGYVQGGIFRYSQIAVIVVRGTERDRLEDWIANYSARLTASPWGRVHLGFDSGASMAEPVLTEALQPWAESLVLAGHSAGGAVAALLAYRLAGLGWRVRELVTFGQPRIGRLEAPAFRWWRYVNRSDVVPHLPPRWWGKGYRHEGRLRWLSGDGRILEPDSPAGFPWIPWALDAMQRRRGELGDENARGWRDHAIGEYVDQLARRRRRRRRRA